MSWAANANPRAIDATPLAATKRAAEGAHGFFLDCSSPTAASPRGGGSGAGSAKASARRSSAPSSSPRPSPSKPSAAALTAQSQGQAAPFGGTAPTAAASSPAPSPAKTLRPSAAAIAAERPQSPSARPSAPAATAAAAPVGLPLHAQQSLRDEVALLKFEAGRWESKLAEKDAALQKLSTALHDLEAAKLAEHARSRAQLAALRKQVVESDTRLDFLRADLTQQKARECQAVARHNVQIAEEQNALLENVTNTIRASATAQVSPAAMAAAASVGLAGATGLGASASAAGVGVGTAMLASSSGANSAASFHGAGTGLTHDEHLKGVLHAFAEERRRWDASRARELASVREEAALRLEEASARAQSIKAHFASAYSKWKAQHAAQCAEIEGLAGYAAKLAYLLEEIDRGKYPVREKHGIRAFVIPAHKRKFLTLDPALAEGGSGALGRRMDELRAALARAGIPWDPRDLGTDQSFLRDERQLQLREMQQQLRIKAAEDEGEDEDDEQAESQPDAAVRGLLRSGRRSAEESKEQTGSDADDEPRSSSVDADTQSRAYAQAETHAHLLEESLLDSLSSHPTVAYIAAVEAERDRYKHLLARETRRKIEMHETLTSQARLIDGGSMLQRAGGGGGAAAKESARQLHHPSSANKARDILAASATMAISQQAGRLGVNVGYSTTAHTRAHSSGGELGMTTGGAFNALGGGAVAALASPSRPITPYTTGGTGGWSRGGARPASAAVLSSPTRAAAGAHHKHSYSTASGFNFAADSHDSTRPTSAISTGAGYAGRSGAVSRPGSAAWIAQQSQSSAAADPSAPQSVLSPAHYPKPTPLHITHGNASATLFAAQLAKKAHQHPAEQQPAHSSTPPSGLSSALPTNRRGSGELGSNPASSRTPARSRAASAGRHRNIEP